MRKSLAAILLLASSIILAACGSSSGISATKVASCAHARPVTVNPSGAQQQIIAKVVHGGWLLQSAGEESEAERSTNTPGFDIYIFGSTKTAEEAFSLIEHAPDPSDEYGGGGTFQRGSVIVSSDQDAPGLPGYAEKLLDNCVGKGTMRTYMREQSSETAPAEEPQTSGEVGAPGEAGPSAGQSPLPGEDE
jgi:ABC-type glycerol-3-phosphate transport system substrate-binding protein